MDESPHTPSAHEVAGHLPSKIFLVLALLAFALLVLSFQNYPSSSSSIHAILQSKTNDFASRGFALKDSKIIDGKLFVLWRKPAPLDTDPISQDSFFEYYATSTSPAFSKEYPGDIEFDSLTGTDINKDGNPEIVVNFFNGGNCGDGCEHIEIFSLKGDTLSPLPVKDTNYFATQDEAAAFANTFFSIIDIDHDETYQLTVPQYPVLGNQSFTEAHACEPGINILYSWNKKDQQYEDVSLSLDTRSHFVSYYFDYISNVEKDFVSATPLCPLGDATDLLMGYVKLGQAETGVRIFNKTFADHGYSQKDITDMRNAIIQQFSTPYLLNSAATPKSSATLSSLAEGYGNYAGSATVATSSHFNGYAAARLDTTGKYFDTTILAYIPELKESPVVLFDYYDKKDQDATIAEDILRTFKVY